MPVCWLSLQKSRWPQSPEDLNPEHAFYKDSKRAEYVSVNDQEALEAFQMLSTQEGIIPASESAHAIAFVKKLAPKMSKKQILVVCLSGRGDKDVVEVQSLLGLKS